MNLQDLDPKVRELVENIINTPHTENFMEAVKIEMLHQVDRWGDEKDKYPHHFQQVISYLNGKLMQAIWNKDVEKYKHHLITIAAVAGNAHLYFEDEGAQKEWFKDALF